MMLAQLTIIAVDDSSDDIFLVERSLKQFRETPQAAGLVLNLVTAQAAELVNTLDRIAEQDCAPRNAVILLDINMPGKNGYEVLEEIRAHPVYFAIPIIMTSGTGDRDDVIRSFSLGCDGFVAKPFQPEGFFTSLSQTAYLEQRLALGAAL